MKNKKNNMKTYIQIDPMTGMRIELRQKDSIATKSLKAVMYGRSFEQVISVLKANGTSCFINGKFVC